MNIFMLTVFLHILDYFFRWEERPSKGVLTQQRAWELLQQEKEVEISFCSY